MENAGRECSPAEMPRKDKYSNLIDLCRKRDRYQVFFNARNVRSAPIFKSPQSSCSILGYRDPGVLCSFADRCSDLATRGQTRVPPIL